jgi:signal transduction histidine kinase
MHSALSLQERTAELRHSYRELSVMEDELIRQQQLAAVGQLAASIAHEVRNPLAVIVNATAGLRRPTLSQPDQQSLLEMIDEEAARLNGLVTDLLRFARPVNITWSKADLRELAQRAVEGLGDEYHVELSLPDNPEISTVCVDAELLRLALSNLIENARQAMPEGGTIRISVVATPTKAGAQVTLEVRDEGHGMQPLVLQRALEPFYTTRPGGTGLGLPIVQRIMQAHGGDVILQSEPQEGTAVTLHIPRYDAQSASPDRHLRRIRLGPSR